MLVSTLLPVLHLADLFAVFDALALASRVQLGTLSAHLELLG